MGKELLTDGMMDSGVGRTLSSYGRPRIRSRSEERMSTMPMISNGYGPMVSVRSEPLSEPIAKTCTNHKPKNSNCCLTDNSILLGIPLPHSKIFSRNEQYDDYNIQDDFEKQRTEKYKQKEKCVDDNCLGTAEECVKLQVPPLSSNRLQPTRHRTKNAILTILDNGEVCIEFIKHKSSMVCIEA